MLIENMKRHQHISIKGAIGLLMTSELNHVETREKTWKNKEEESKEPPKCQIVLKWSIDDGTSSRNMSDE